MLASVNLPGDVQRRRSVNNIVFLLKSCAARNTQSV
jgi:hypothetical protein